MKLVTLNCNHCGGPLEVPSKTRYLTCGYCDARLEIKSSGNAVYSEVLEALHRKTEQISEDVETIKTQNQLERLDREWMMTRGRYLVRNKRGEEHIPTTVGSVAVFAFVALFGVFWLSMAINMGAPFFFPLFGLLFIGFAVFSLFASLRKAKGYRNSRIQYESERRRLLSEIRKND